MRCGKCGCPVEKIRTFTRMNIDLVRTKCTSCGHERTVTKVIWDDAKLLSEHMAKIRDLECARE